MKTVFLGVLCFVASFLLLVSCGNGAGKDFVNASADVRDVIESIAAEKAASNAVGLSGVRSGVRPETGTAAEERIDIDLTSMSSSMVYSTVYDMLTNPDPYKGKTVKMKGPFAVYLDETTGNRFFACIIRDATACCAQGMEFALRNAGTWPDDYPELGTEVTVVGTFGTYVDDGYMYCTLKDSVFVV